MIIQGTIESIAFGGEGILRHDGLVVFVPFTAPGDTVEIEIVSKKKNFAHGKLLHIKHPSPTRIAPKCFYFGNCGGCQLQHLNYPAQLQSKSLFIIDALKRIGKIDVPELDIAAANEQWHYRRHIRLKLKIENEGFKAGYMGCDPSQFVPIAKCPLFIPSEEPLLGTLEPFLLSLSNQGINEGSLRLIKAKQGAFILAFQFSPALPNNAKKANELLTHPTHVQGVVMHSAEQQIKFGDASCETEVLGLKVRFSPFGFVQNHPEQSENLYRAILQALPDCTKNILDLYCGIGITSLLFAKSGREVFGVESHDETIALATQNAVINEISNAKFQKGMAEILGVELIKKHRPDAVLCNPPRTGMDPSLLEALATEKPACILYVSCMPSTLARDLQKLIQSGYKIDSIQGFDMFPQTTHVETLVKLVLF